MEAAKNEYNQLLDTVPPQLQLVWDNVNMHSKHRYKRCDDDAGDTKLDWMGCLWIEDRINANHMDHREGIALKDIKDLTISDFIPTDMEKDYVFQSLISQFSYCLVKRYPLIFKSITHAIRPNRPHQFQREMDGKSRELTGKLFTKSETKMEDLIAMMEEIQLDVHRPKGTEDYCYERKIVRYGKLMN